MCQDLLPMLRKVSYARFPHLTQFKVTHDYTVQWYALLLFRGRVRYTIAQGGEHFLSAGELLWIPPYYNIDKIAESPSDAGILFAPQTDADGAGRVRLGNPVMRITPRMYEDARLIATPAADPYRQLLVLDLWYQIRQSRAAPQIPAPPEPASPIAKLLDEVGKSYAQKWTLAEMCKRSGYAKSSLIRAFRVFTGKTPMDYILTLRINAAKKLLGDTRCTLREIAARCGFANEFYLSTAFKARTGETPSEFRKGHGSA